MDEPKQQDVSEYIWNEAALLMLRLDPEGRVREANAFARRYVGEQYVGRLFNELVVGFTANRDPVQLAEAGPCLVSLNTPSGPPATFRMGFLPQADGLLAIGSPDVQGLEKLQTQVLGLNHDLSDLGRQLQKANAELQALSALKNQFLGMAAHDLRTPLGAIISFTQFLHEEAGPSLTDEHNEFIDIILQSSQRMQNLIEDFLDVSMIESGKLHLTREPVNVGTIVAGVRSMIDLVARTKGVILETEISDPDLILDVDEAKIGQVLINLIRNAIEYSKAGGRVWISTRQEGDLLRFSVADEAGGIPEEQCKQIFAPFGRAETLKTGGERSIGLGLTIAKKIVDAHGGTLCVESEWGSGTTFSFAPPITTGTV